MPFDAFGAAFVSCVTFPHGAAPYSVRCARHSDNIDNMRERAEKPQRLTREELSGFEGLEILFGDEAERRHAFPRVKPLAGSIAARARVRQAIWPTESEP